ncbi:hypothetical protein CDQ84_07600 [Clostridium thermosuccinogenes]|jgi:ABC-type glycerol-3-phosphate transport system substrate-binding protein|uniref:Sugar ABC transporter substrate-binding protein n=1 Tax=Clostridium thermosuccinogenes TaxID=84032 RepID=A0A2K2FGH6_9CLOT|nr:extracellular solute-binding protein [Pseudoclostridium thermosuccinogenes]AUS95926.1 hypothetical protein CDO33_05405 [Pseudoclostridium thermosuccinogenes]PNT93359.1 hypothetical protein CDQ83_07565 [Pseudoclostridium thermosuccinogenes]PNT97887.1 hypothetical protein CDQ85_07100 [Pseudoclostridium thermosuccinogenes]PNT99819.1 hypothetical protein CDQ84_07600 [Pseudoclostridium thermosuccinogenes]
MLKKRGITWVLLLAMIIGIIASGCGSSDKKTTTDSTTNAGSTASTETPEETTPEEPEEQDDGSGLPDQDLGGYVFTVADNNASRWFPEAGSSDLANAIIERINWVQEKFNCKIEIRNHSEDEFATAVMAGDKYADIIVTPTWELGRHIKAKRLVNMNTIPHLRLDAEYWNRYDSTSYLSYGDIKYGTAAPFITQSDEVWVIAFNKAIIEELGLENPYDLVKNKQWTFEKMLEMQQAAKRDLNGDGAFDSNDRYGLATGHDWDISVVLYLASGNKIIDVKEDGTMKYVVNTPKAFETIDMIKKMCKRGDTFFPKNDGEDMDAYVKAFTEGKVLFLAYSRGRGVIDPIYEMEDDFGFVPMPMGNNTNEYKCWVSHDAPSLAVPVSNPDLDKTGLILEALAWKSQDEDELRLNEVAYTKLRDDESFEILKELGKYAVSDMAFIGQQLDGAIWQGLNVLPHCGFYVQDEEPASKVASVEEQVAIGIENARLMLLGQWVEPEPEENNEG